MPVLNRDVLQELKRLTWTLIASAGVGAPAPPDIAAVSVEYGNTVFNMAAIWEGLPGWMVGSVRVLPPSGSSRLYLWPVVCKKL